MRVVHNFSPRVVLLRGGQPGEESHLGLTRGLFGVLSVEVPVGVGGEHLEAVLDSEEAERLRAVVEAFLRGVALPRFRCTSPSGTLIACRDEGADGVARLLLLLETFGGVAAAVALAAEELRAWPGLRRTAAEVRDD